MRSYNKPSMQVLRVIALILFLPWTLTAQSYISGYGGSFSRLKPEAFDFDTFRSGPTSTTTPVFGAGGGTKIWKILADANLLVSRTGQTNVIIGFSRAIEINASGHALLIDGGAGWPLLRIAGFQTAARGGYGFARVRVPTEIPIEDDRHFWTYGIVASRPLLSRYVLRFDVRNVHFGREETPLTLGRFNVIVLAGFGLKF